MLYEFLSAVLLLQSSLATFGVDVTAYTNTFSCLRSSYGCQFMITRAWMSYGAYDSNAPKNLDNAESAGISYRDVYLFPCRGQSASTQVDTMMNDLAAANTGRIPPTKTPEGTVIAHGLQAGYPKVWNVTQKPPADMNYTFTDKNDHSWHTQPNDKVAYGMVWLDIETNPSTGCSWTGYSGSDNCNYIQSLVNAVKSKGGSPGIYSSQYMWGTIVGSTYGCTSVSSVPVWYAHYDGVASFSDWSSVSFGGWSKPAMKQYEGDAYLCSTSVDENYY